MGTKQNKQKFRMILQSHEKLRRDVARILSIYQLLHNALDSIFNSFRITSINALGVMRLEQEIQQKNIEIKTQ